MLSLGEGILLTLLTLCMTHILKYAWERRYLYIYSMKVPGPWTVPIIGSFFFRRSPQDIHAELTKLTEKYKGEIFRFWVGSELCFVISDVKHIELVSNSSKCLNKGYFSDAIMKIMGDGLIAASREKWKRHRKILMPIFNKKNLESFAETFTKHGNTLLLNLEKYAKSGEMISDMDIYYTGLSANIATLVGVQVEDLDCSFAAYVQKGLGIQVLRHFTTSYRWEWLFNLMPAKKEVEECSKNTYGLSEKLIKERKAMISNDSFDFKDDTKINALLDYVPKFSQDQNAPLTFEELRDHITTFLVAADTSTTAVSFMLTALAVYPDIQKKVYEEVMEVIGPVRDVQTTDLPKLKYTEMVAKETMRHFAPVPFIFKKIEEDITLGPTFVPKGTTISIAIGSVHNNPELWPNPSEFDPERFQEEKVAKNSYSLLPFSAGIRACPGDKLAMMYIKILIATVVRKFQFFTEYKSLKEIELTYNYVIGAKNGYRLRIHERNN